MSIVTEQELKTKLDIGTRPALIRYLAQKHIPFERTPKGKVWTVQKAIDRVLIPDDNNKQDDDWELDNAP